MKHPAHHATTSPDKVAYQMLESGKSLSYAELDRRSNQGAQAFRSLDIRQGDHIAIMMENRLEFMEICWAGHRAGIIYTLISRYLLPSEAAYIVRDCGAKSFITSENHVSLATELLATIDEDIFLFSVDGALGPFASWKALVLAMPGPANL